jgi:hypothetical protein
MLELLGAQLRYYRRSQAAAFLNDRLNANLSTFPNFAGLLGGDILRGQCLGLYQQFGNGRQLFFAVPSLKLLKRRLGLRALGIAEVNVAV